MSRGTYGRKAPSLVLIGYRCQAFNNHELFIDKSKKVERI